MFLKDLCSKTTIFKK